MAMSAPVQSAFHNLGNGTGVASVCLLVAAVVLATVPLQIPELTLSLVGAIVYSALQLGQSKNKKLSKKSKLKSEYSPAPQSKDWARPSGRRVHDNANVPRTSRDLPEQSKKDVRQPSVAPVSAPTFTAVGWEGEVQELLKEIAPTTEGVQVVKTLVERARRAIQVLIPEAEVTGFGCGKLKRGKAFGVAVPDVDIVVSVSPGALVQALQRHLRSSHVAKLDARKLQKSAIRVCTDQLVSAGGFKFRRSAFKGADPKVTLLGPILHGVCDEAIPIDFSVNSATPLHNAALLTESTQLQPNARDLILFVQRWARDRGISHAAKGHLPPYGWSLLTIYFLQAGVSDEGPLLPPLKGFERSSALAGIKWDGSAAANQKTTKKSVGELFKEFIRFYESEFNFRNEAVCVRHGKRAAPELSLPIHVVVDDGGNTMVAMSIEDPFEVSRNVGSFLNGAGCVRLREELTRAMQLCSAEDGGSLCQLLEPWAPPEWQIAADPANDDQA